MGYNPTVIRHPIPNISKALRSAIKIDIERTSGKIRLAQNKRGGHRSTMRDGKHFGRQSSAVFLLPFHVERPAFVISYRLLTRVFSALLLTRLQLPFDL